MAATPDEIVRYAADDDFAIETNPQEKHGVFGKIMIKAFGATDSMPATMAQQIFSIVPGIAGGLSGFILASKLAKARRVQSKGVWIAAGLNALLTFATIFLIVEADEIKEAK